MCLKRCCIFNLTNLKLSFYFALYFVKKIFTYVSLISRNTRLPRKKLLTLFTGLKQSLKMNCQIF